MNQTVKKAVLICIDESYDFLNLWFPRYKKNDNIGIDEKNYCVRFRENDDEIIRTDTL